MKTRVKLELIANRTKRRASFMKRKKGMMKKLHELTTLCDVKACAVINSPFEKKPQVWPSTEGVKEVVSKFMELPARQRSKKEMSHETYLRDRINKVEEQVKKLSRENRESEIREFMFECIEGKPSHDHPPYDARDLQDLSSYIDHYLNQLYCRLMSLNGESSSLPSLIPPVFAGANPPLVADATMATAPIGFYHNMNMNLNQFEPVQHHVPAGFNDHIQYQNMMTINQNQQEPVQYQTPLNFNDQFKNMSLDLNQYPYQQGSLMNLLMEHPQEMGYVGEHAHIPFIDGNHYNYHQLPTTDLATTDHLATTAHMLPISTTTTTTTTSGVHAPYLNNNL